MKSDIIPLILQAQDGDRAAFSQLVQRFQDMAVGYAYSILGDFHLAEDAAQEAFVQAYLDLPKLREPQAFASWFRRIVFKYCDRQYRGKQVWTVPLEKVQHLSSHDQGPLQHAASHELSDKIMDIIQALPEAQRVVTTLFYINGYTQAEVGEFLDVPVTTVKSRLHQARKSLQQSMTNIVKETLKQHAPGKEFTRKVEQILDGVENIEWKKGSNCFSGSVVACMKFLNDPVGYHIVAGVSGVAFHTQWAWAPDNCDPMGVIGDEIIRRTFRVLGYTYTHRKRSEQPTPDATEDVWREHIMNSINHGKPVLAFGVVGPPECCVIAGYSQQGDVLLGRSYFYKDTHGYFRQADWYRNCLEIIEIGEKVMPLRRKDMIRESLQWAVKVAHTTEMNGRTTGLAAYDVWAEALERDEDFPEDDMNILTLRCMASTDDGFWYLADVRYAASRFLAEIAPDTGQAEDDMKAASECYDTEARLLWQGAKKSPSHHSPESERLRIADRNLRLELAQLVREAYTKDCKATEHLERALGKLS